MKSNLPSALGLCKKAGRLAAGFDAAANAIKQDKARLLLLAGDLSPKSAGKILRLARGKNITALTVRETMDELWYVLGKRAGVLAVTDRNLAAMVTGMKSQNEEETSL